MLQELTFEDLRLSLDDEQADRLVVELTGRSMMRHPGEVLRPWFAGLIARAVGARRIEIHFEKLEHFNSSTIAALVQIMNDAADAGVQLELFYDATLAWQRMSFDAISRAIRPFATSGAPVVTIRPV